MHFLDRKYMDLDENLTEIYSQRSNQQYSSIGSDNNLVLSRWQATVWTNDG